jgi:hypothetical protein
VKKNKGNGIFFKNIQDSNVIGNTVAFNKRVHQTQETIGVNARAFNTAAFRWDNLL